MNITIIYNNYNVLIYYIMYIAIHYNAVIYINTVTQYTACYLFFIYHSI